MNLYMENGSNPFDDFWSQLTGPSDRFFADVRLWLTNLEEVQGLDSFFVETLRWLCILGFTAVVGAIFCGPLLLLYKRHDIVYYLRDRKQNRMMRRFYEQDRMISRPLKPEPEFTLGQVPVSHSEPAEPLVELPSEELSREFLEYGRRLINPEHYDGSIRQMVEVTLEIDALLRDDSKYAPVLRNHARAHKALMIARDRLQQVISERTDKDFADIKASLLSESDSEEHSS